MAVRRSKFAFALALIIAICGCAPRPADIVRIALLSSFEGRYREVGYNAFYAARLALQDFGDTKVELLAIDDGGTVASAALRAQALATDPLVQVVIALGYNATAPETQHAFGDLPVIIVGSWDAKPEATNIFILSSADLSPEFSTTERLPVTATTHITDALVGSEIFALEQFPKLTTNAQNITIASNASLPDEDFRERYASMGQFVPEPGLLATLTYDAFGLALQAIKIPDVEQDLATSTYQGLNGEIRFQDGYWANAPIHYYTYGADGRIIKKP